MQNVEQIRYNMVEQQVRPWDVLDSNVLNLMDSTPREAFVPASHTNVAYADIEVPLGHGEIMLAPRVVGRLMQAVNPHSSDVALEVGTGSGYLTALLAQACRQVYSVDIHADFVEAARTKLAAQNLTNVTLETGDAAKGWDKHQPYDVIIITGSLPVLPESFQHSLQRGGRMAAIVGDGPVMEAILITRSGENEWSREVLFETDLAPLKNAAQPERFTF